MKLIFSLQVKVVHLPDIGVTDYGELHNFGASYFPSAPLEIFFNGKPLRLAEWPNNVGEPRKPMNLAISQDCFDGNKANCYEQSIPF